MHRTRLERITDELLRAKGEPDLRSLIEVERSQGASFELIARRIFVLTDEAIDVSARTVARWINAAGGEAA